MNSSIIGYIQKIKDGPVFKEGFENDNFLSAEGWITVQGSPANSSQQYKQGIKSFKCSGTGPTLAIIKKNNIPTAPQTSTLTNVWFYDDGTTTPGTGPFAKIKTQDGKFFQIGVRNDVDNTQYVCNPTDVSTEDTFAIPTGGTVLRTVGWHSFQIVNEIVSGTMQFFCDGNFIEYVTTGGFSPVTEAYLQSGMVGDLAGTFGFFDSLLVCRQWGINFVDFNGRAVQGYNSAYTQLGFSGLTLASTSVFIPLLGFATDGLFPLSMKLMTSQKIPTDAITDNWYKFESCTPFMEIFPGDILAYKSIDFGRKVQIPREIPTVIRNVNVSSSGVQESMKYSDKDHLTFVIRLLNGLVWKQRADDWFRFADAGGNFSIVGDSGFAAFALNDDDVLANNFTITLKAGLPTNPTDRFTVGRKYVLRRKDNTTRQTVTLQSKTTTQLTFEERLNFDMAEGDYVMDTFVYPVMELGQNNLGGFVLSRPRTFIFDWTQEVQETIES